MYVFFFCLLLYFMDPLHLFHYILVGGFLSAVRAAYTLVLYLSVCLSVSLHILEAMSLLIDSRTYDVPFASLVDCCFILFT